MKKLDGFLDSADELLTALKEYNAATDRLTGLDMEGVDGDPLANMDFVVDDLEDILGEREEIRVRVFAAKEMMLRELELLGGDEAAAIREYLRAAVGGERGASPSGELAAAGTVVDGIAAVQREILAKDGDVARRLDSKRGEIKIALKGLQDERRKLDFMNTTAPGGQDSGFSV